MDYLKISQIGGVQNRKHGGGQEVDVVKLFIVEGRCFVVIFIFLIGGE